MLPKGIAEIMFITDQMGLVNQLDDEYFHSLIGIFWIYMDIDEVLFTLYSQENRKCFIFSNKPEYMMAMHIAA